jgi:ABC-type Mn2+/Zn2+ transport system ATPase subunit
VGKSRLYPLIIGEHGTGKTSLISLAVNDINEPKGVVYVDIPLECDSAVNIAKAMQKALG